MAGQWFSPGSLYDIGLKFIIGLCQVSGILQVVYTILCEVCQWLVSGQWFSPLYTTLCEACQWPMTGQWYSLGTLYNIMWSLSVTYGRSFDIIRVF